MAKFNVPEIMPKGLKAHMSQRRDLIVDTTKAWIEVAPQQAKIMAKALHGLTAVQINDSGKYARGGGYCQVRMPSDLWHSLRKVFKMYLPDQEPFGQLTSDVAMLCDEFPRLIPSNDKKSKT